MTPSVVGWAQQPVAPMAVPPPPCWWCEADGSWTVRGLDAFGLTLTNSDMAELAEWILARAR